MKLRPALLATLMLAATVGVCVAVANQPILFVIGLIVAFLAWCWWAFYEMFK